MSKGYTLTGMSLGIQKFCVGSHSIILASRYPKDVHLNNKCPWDRAELVKMRRELVTVNRVGQSYKTEEK
jgi:hypothetical protein